MVNLVLFLDAAQYRHGLFDRRFAYEHLLKSALERGVFFDVFAVFIERGRTDSMQLAAGQCRLEHIARIKRALTRARAHDGVQLIDKEDDTPVRLLDLAQHRLEPVFEFATIFRTRNHRA